MLSRQAACRSSVLVNQLLRPCAAATVTSSKNLSVSAHQDNKYAWYKTAWPAIEMYKGLAGQSAGPVFGLGLAAYLISKEIYVINDEVLLIFVMGSTGYHLCKTVANPISKMLDDMSNAKLEEMNRIKNENIATLEDGIEFEQEAMNAVSLRDEFFDVSRNEEEIKLEIEYRARLLEVEKEVKKRLDYQVDLQSIEWNIEEKHMASWVEKEVIANIAEQPEEDTLLQCIRDLNMLADAKAAA